MKKIYIIIGILVILSIVGVSSIFINMNDKCDNIDNCICENDYCTCLKGTDKEYTCKR